MGKQRETALLLLRFHQRTEDCGFFLICVLSRTDPCRTADYLNESHDENEKRFILNSLNFLKKEGPSPSTLELIGKEVCVTEPELFRVMKNPYYNPVLAQESQSDKVTYQLLKNMNETFNAQGGNTKFQKFLKNQNFTRLSPLFTCHCNSQLRYN